MISFFYNEGKNRGVAQKREIFKAIVSQKLCSEPGIQPRRLLGVPRRGEGEREGHRQLEPGRAGDNGLPIQETPAPERPEGKDDRKAREFGAGRSRGFRLQQKNQKRAEGQDHFWQQPKVRDH